MVLPVPAYHPDVSAEMMRAAYARGGEPRPHNGREINQTHSGPIVSAVSGRTDHLNMSVPNNSYIIPADIVSGTGEGNTLAGFEIWKKALPEDDGSDDGENPDQVKIVAAGGEYGIKPNQIRAIGGGDYKRGFDIIDNTIVRMRNNIISEMKKLPPPKR
jgi:hypothetical protein